MITKNSDHSIPRLVYCPTCKRRAMEIKKVGLGKRNNENVVQYVCAKCGQSKTDSSRSAG